MKKNRLLKISTAIFMANATFFGTAMADNNAIQNAGADTEVIGSTDITGLDTSQQSVAIASERSEINGSRQGAIIASSDSSVFYEPDAQSSYNSVIIGATRTHINNSRGVITGGADLSKIASSSNSAIMGGAQHEINNTFTSAILGGNKNSIVRGLQNAIIGGSHNTLNGPGEYSVIVGGTQSEINNGATNALVIGGQTQVYHQIILLRLVQT